MSPSAQHRDAGVGIVLTTHIVEEAVADRVVVLHRGRVLVADTPSGPTSLLPDRVITARTGLDDAELVALLLTTVVGAGLAAAAYRNLRV